jgi:carbon-monoxide dehydrogenase medium subunit
MKPAPFELVSAAGLKDAMASLSTGSAKPVSGNQSLGPMLNLRLSRPTTLVDISLAPELRVIEEGVNWVRLGAAFTHAEIEDGEIADPTPGWLRSAASNIAYRAVRNRGTLGGSLAHSDPAADWCIVMTGLGAVILIDGPTGERRMPVEEFLIGPFTTALASGEIIRAVEVPRPGTGARWGYWKYMRQVGEFAKASAAVLHDPARSVARCALGALSRQPMLLNQPLAVIEGEGSPADAVQAALPDCKPVDLAMHITALTRALAMLKGESK